MAIDIHVHEEQVSVGAIKDVVEKEPILQSKNVTENGIITPDEGYDGLEQVNVNVQFEPKLQNMNITKNGSYSASEGYDGLGEVIVNVQGSGGGDAGHIKYLNPTIKKQSVSCNFRIKDVSLSIAEV